MVAQTRYGGLSWPVNGIPGWLQQEIIRRRKLLQSKTVPLSVQSRQFDLDQCTINLDTGPDAEYLEWCRTRDRESED